MARRQSWPSRLVSARGYATGNEQGKALLWVPAHAHARELVAVYRAQLRDKITGIELARRLGLSIRTIRWALSKPLRAPNYAKTWRPIASEFLSAPCSVAGKLLLTALEREGEQPRPLKYFARLLGWKERRTRWVLDALRSADLVRVAGEQKRGSVRTLTLLPNMQKPARPKCRYRRGQDAETGAVAHLSVVKNSTQVPTAPAGTLTNAPALTVGGWRELMQPTARAELVAGPDAGSIARALGAVGVYARDPTSRRRFAQRLARRGVTVEQVLATIVAAHEPRPSEGRVLRPAAMVRHWLEAGDVDRRPPVAVGPKVLRAELARRELAAKESAQAVDTAARRTRLRSALAGMQHGVTSAMLHQALLDAAYLSDKPDQVVPELQNARGSLATLLEAVCRLGVPALFDALPGPLRAVALAEARHLRET